ncbi:unnamed protein product [Eruca vesicaria subsp. sativa]|uniref:Uncharacterized protein n=1 Tax=Eruca vesicaria subsp. sativa TaxID=29727 RepID=A0ABC8M704_ERUVS|nr:unnamed protein product [Eruca vesicaria subsp. sativa]
MYGYVMQGNLVKISADASSADEHGLSATHNILSFLGAVATTTAVETMKKEGEPLLQSNPRDKL